MGGAIARAATAKSAMVNIILRNMFDSCAGWWLECLLHPQLMESVRSKLGRRRTCLGRLALWPRHAFQCFINGKRYGLRSGRSRRCRTASGPWEAWRKRWKFPRIRQGLPTGQNAFSWSISIDPRGLIGQMRAAMAAIGCRHMHRAARPDEFAKHTRLGGSDGGRDGNDSGSKQGNGEDHFA